MQHFPCALASWSLKLSDVSGFINRAAFELISNFVWYNVDGFKSCSLAFVDTHVELMACLLAERKIGSICFVTTWLKSLFELVGEAC